MILNFFPFNKKFLNQFSFKDLIIWKKFLKYRILLSCKLFVQDFCCWCWGCLFKAFSLLLSLSKSLKSSSVTLNIENFTFLSLRNKLETIWNVKKVSATDNFRLCQCLFYLYLVLGASFSLLLVCYCYCFSFVIFSVPFD